MPTDEMFRVSPDRLDWHSEQYPRTEARIARDLRDTLRIAANAAPMDRVSHIRRLMNDADALERYCKKVEKALNEMSELTRETSRTVLERFDDASEGLETLLK